MAHRLVYSIASWSGTLWRRIRVGRNPDCRSGWPKKFREKSLKFEISRFLDRCARGLPHQAQRVQLLLWRLYGQIVDLAVEGGQRRTDAP